VCWLLFAKSLCEYVLLYERTTPTAGDAVKKVVHYKTGGRSFFFALLDRSSDLLMFELQADAVAGYSIIQPFTFKLCPQAAAGSTCFGGSMTIDSQPILWMGTRYSGAPSGYVKSLKLASILTNPNLPLETNYPFKTGRHVDVYEEFSGTGIFVLPGPSGGLIKRKTGINSGMPSDLSSTAKFIRSHQCNSMNCLFLKTTPQVNTYAFSLVSSALSEQTFMSYPASGFVDIRGLRGLNHFVVCNSSSCKFQNLSTPTIINRELLLDEITSVDSSCETAAACYFLISCCSPPTVKVYNVTLTTDSPSIRLDLLTDVSTAQPLNYLSSIVGHTVLLFADASGIKIVRECPLNCLTCDLQFRCTKCNVGYWLDINSATCTTCQLPTEKKTTDYEDPSLAICIVCDAGAAKCADCEHSPNYCVKCLPGYGLLEASNNSCSSCEQPNHFMDTTAEVHRCSICSAAGRFIELVEGRHQCSACESQCSSCSMKSWNCTACASGQLIETCVSQPFDPVQPVQPVQQQYYKLSFTNETSRERHFSEKGNPLHVFSFLISKNDSNTLSSPEEWHANLSTRLLQSVRFEALGEKFELDHRTSLDSSDNGTKVTVEMMGIPSAGKFKIFFFNPLLQSVSIQEKQFEILPFEYSSEYQYPANIEAVKAAAQQGEVAGQLMSIVPSNQQAANELVLVAMSSDPTGVLSKFSQLLKLVSKLSLINVKVGLRLNKFLDSRQTHNKEDPVANTRIHTTLQSDHLRTVFYSECSFWVDDEFQKKSSQVGVVLDVLPQQGSLGGFQCSDDRCGILLHESSSSQQRHVEHHGQLVVPRDARI